MHTRQIMMTAALMAVLGATSLQAQGFDSGSTGSDGALDITDNTTLTVPPSGVFNFQSLRLRPGVTLQFQRNALNTPVYLLATGNILIEGVVALNGTPGTANPPVGGQGGPGGFAGGDPGVQSIPPGAGHGPGGGNGGDPNVVGTSAASAGAAAHGGAATQVSTSDGTVYGSPLLVPLAGGSGGGGGVGLANGTPGIGGSGGGGAILLASNTRIDVTGQVNAVGGSNQFPHTGQGSGGAIRFVAPIVAGGGFIQVRGGTGGVNDANGDQGGNGRVRIDTIDRTSLRFTYDVQGVFSIGSFMSVFPPVVPRLDLVRVAGQNIPEGSGPVDIVLPFGSAATQTIQIRAYDFTGTVPIRIVLTPATGNRVVQDTQINMTTNPAEIAVFLSFPINTRTEVSAWTR